MVKEKLKGYSEKELQKYLEEEKAKWNDEVEKRIASEREDAMKMAKMNESERADAEFKKRQKAFDDEKSQYMAERMEFEAAKALSKENLPVTFAAVLKGKDSEETANNVAMFKEEFLAEVEKAVSQKLRGAAPKTGVAQKENDPFLSGFTK